MHNIQCIHSSTQSVIYIHQQMHNIYRIMAIDYSHLAHRHIYVDSSTELTQLPHNMRLQIRIHSGDDFFRLTLPSFSPFFLVVSLPHAHTQVKKHIHC